MHYAPCICQFTKMNRPNLQTKLSVWRTDVIAPVSGIWLVTFSHLLYLFLLLSSTFLYAIAFLRTRTCTTICWLELNIYALLERGMIKCNIIHIGLLVGKMKSCIPRGLLPGQLYYYCPGFM